MYDYNDLKNNHSSEVSRTVDDPIMIFDYWEFSDAIIAIFIIMVFGVVFYSWFIMFFLLFLCLVLGPIIKKKNNRGIYFHWPYRFFGISLPGLINPLGRNKFSD